MKAFVLAACAFLVAGIAHAADTPSTVVLPAYVVTATRSIQSVDTLPVTVDRFSGAELSSSASLVVDDVLRASPAFSLFRRTSSLSAHPTAQGVSLRGIGPSGAGRTLVLLDGIPLNDPFGGWVAWSKVPRLGLGSAEIVRGGGSSTWGSAALGGVVQLLTRPTERSGGEAVFEAGEHGTRRAEALATFQPGQRATMNLGARWFSTDGFFQNSPEQRGAIDRPLDSEHKLVHGDVGATLASGMRVSVSARVFDEDRGNGTPFQRNDSRESAASLRVAGEMRPDLAIEMLAYAQSQSFAARFSGVDDTRASETPALDQFDVPSTAYGAAFVATWRPAREATTTAGVDLRQVRGETREEFFFSGGRFLRQRFAGGEQLTGGAFLSHRRDISGSLTAQFGARFDGWRLADGHRREEQIDSGALVRDDHYADRDGGEFSPSFGLSWRASESLRVRGAVYRAFRVPTLNEFFRPFRVGNVSTEANPDLKNETLAGADLGLEWTRETWTLSLGGFSTRLVDAVANVTLSSTPALVQRQRRNLDKVDVRGVEFGASWTPVDALTLGVAYLLSDARVERASVAPDLEGRRLPQVPRHAGSVRAAWRPCEALRLSALARISSSQFEDDENVIRLGSACTFDVAAEWRLSEVYQLVFAVENLSDERIEASRSTAGLVTYASPRLSRIAVRAAW